MYITNIKIVVLIGAPGSGKTTLSKLVVTDFLSDNSLIGNKVSFDYKIVVFGDEVRRLVKGELRKRMNQGYLLNDNDVNDIADVSIFEMIKNYCSRKIIKTPKFVDRIAVKNFDKDNVIESIDLFFIDGYPRTLNQYEHFKSTIFGLRKYFLNFGINLCVYFIVLEVFKNILKKRLLKRGSCVSCEKNFLKEGNARVNSVCVKKFAWNEKFTKNMLDIGNICTFARREDDLEEEKILRRFKEYKMRTAVIVSLIGKDAVKFNWMYFFRFILPVGRENFNADDLFEIKRFILENN